MKPWKVAEKADMKVRVMIVTVIEECKGGGGRVET